MTIEYLSETRADVTRIHVCITCRAEVGEEPRAGALMFGALQAAFNDDPAVQVIPVECLSVCKRPCSVAFSAPGKWTYVYGDLPADTGVAVVREAAALYGATTDGLIPWRLRPDAIKKGVVARIPPLPIPSQAS
ncbi:DUF1636 domain-containing protein [Lichenifustis flavocetrariae]|uniref:DUF1636 domain-containing protein n=1 Tax=Lichenifustis flavocetrariae TaxID=2949735 RepID=A0AA41Z0L2_9HYPH|nr:DUF1636 domain-containing protein [Lichenifustis flavocetrariae]MCW6510650.1 DUF1636 domain-containing protein [Lichenifustis flavocetrariae]